jgi:hypothetical protein
MRQHAIELGGPEDEGIGKETTGVEVLDEAGGGLVADGEVAIVVGLEGLVGFPVEQAVAAGDRLTPGGRQIERQASPGEWMVFRRGYFSKPRR